MEQERCQLYKQRSISMELDNLPFEIDLTQKQEIMVEHV